MKTALKIFRVALSVLLFAGILAGTAIGGLAVTMDQSFPEAPPAGGPWPEPKPVKPGRTVVAVLAGMNGSVGTDLLAPYSVFARSDFFSVHVVAQRREPVALSGGLTLLPDYTFATMPPPDVVVVPAVAEPTAAPLRDFLVAQANRGAKVLGVCAGVEVVAATGLLDGRRATSYWADLDGLDSAYPKVEWLRGKRFVEDGEIVTTAGVTSGVAGALRVVELLAGAGEARRVAEQIAYPGSALDIPVNRYEVADLPYLLGGWFPYLRQSLGIGLVDGVDELDVAAAFDVYSGTSSATHAIPIAIRPAVTTRHGAVLLAHKADSAPSVDRLVVPGAQVADPELASWARARDVELGLPHAAQAPGEFTYDPLLRDLAAQTDRATARMTAKYTEYPVPQGIQGAPWPWRPTLLALLAIAVALALATTPWFIRRRGALAPPARQRDPDPQG